MQRRRFLKQLAGYSSIVALNACSNNHLSPVTNIDEKKLYIDGLSFVPDYANDVKASQLDSFIADNSAIEEIKLADGSVNYKRTYYTQTT